MGADLERNLNPDSNEQTCWKRAELERGEEWREKAREHQIAENEFVDYDGVAQVLQATLNEQADTMNFQLFKLRKFGKRHGKKLDAIAAKIDEQTAILKDVAYYLRLLSEKE